MRTTLTIEADVAERLRQETANGRKSLKQAVNERLRIGFGITRQPTTKPYKVVTHRSPYCSGIDRSRLNQIADELEADAFNTRKRAN